MGAKKLGVYILDHDEKSFYVEDGEAKKIEYSSSSKKAIISDTGEIKKELTDRDDRNYINFTFSFDELNFDDEDHAVEVLEAFAKDIAEIEINNKNKSSWQKQLKLGVDIDEDFDNLDDNQKEEKIREVVKKNYKDDIEILNWERTKNGWDKEVVKVKLRKTYDRQVTLDDSIISIHTKSSDKNHNKNKNYKVKPHLHLVLDRNKTYGKNFSKLKKELAQTARDHNLTANNNVEIKKERSKEYKILKDRLTNFSWVVAKHDNPAYAKDQLDEYRGENAVTLDNVENKLNRLLELEGSYDFARKLKINLKEKFDMEIDLEDPKSYKKADEYIQNKDYEKIIDEVRKKATTGEKISERYKEYSKEILENKDKVNLKELATAKAIKGIVKNRGYVYNQNWEKVVDTKKINNIADREIERVNFLDNDITFTKFKEKINNNLYIREKDLRKDLFALEIDENELKEVIGASKGEIIFKGVESHIRNNLDLNNYEKTEISTIRTISEVETDLDDYNIHLEINNIKSWYFEAESKKINKLRNLNNLKLTKQTDEAILVSNKIWLPKSVVEYGMIDDLENKTETIKEIDITKNIDSKEFFEDIKEQIKEIDEEDNLDTSNNWQEQIALKIYSDRNLDWKDIAEVNDLIKQVESFNLDLNIDLNRFANNLYWEKFIEVKETAIKNIDFDNIDLLNAFEDINNQLDDLDISEDMKNQIAGSIYKEKIDKDKVKEAWKEKINNQNNKNSIASKINQLEKSYQKFAKKFKKVFGEEETEFEKEIKQTKQILLSFFNLGAALENDIMAWKRLQKREGLLKEKSKILSKNIKTIKNNLNKAEENLINKTEVNPKNNIRENLSSEEINKKIKEVENKIGISKEKRERLGEKLEKNITKKKRVVKKIKTVEKHKPKSFFKRKFNKTNKNSFLYRLVNEDISEFNQEDLKLFKENLAKEILNLNNFKDKLTNFKLSEEKKDILKNILSNPLDKSISEFNAIKENINNLDENIDKLENQLEQLKTAKKKIESETKEKISEKELIKDLNKKKKLMEQGLKQTNNPKEINALKNQIKEIKNRIKKIDEEIKMKSEFNFER